MIGLFLFNHPCLQSQTIRWQDYPDKTFVFEISNNEAEKLLKSNPEDSLILQMLHSPVASFTKQWEKAPKQGHFILVDIYKNRTYYRYKPILPFQVFLLKEYGALTLQVVDAEGNVRKDAKVKIKGKWRLWDTNVCFDKRSYTYTTDDASENTDRLLTVELDTFRAIFRLEKHLVHSWYGYDNDSEISPEFYSYMITDKNKYKPGETVRFKSYALSARKRPLKEELTLLMLMPNHQYKKITTLPPYHPGGFAGEIQLHDSLKLQLDRSYQLQLRSKNGRIVANTSFRYEAYELYDNTLYVHPESDTHYYPDTNRVVIKATDTNGLPLQDVKADVLVRRKHISKACTDILILPDTLLYKRILLNNDSSATVTIPPDILGEADGAYEVSVEAITPDGQQMVRTNTVGFYRSHYDIQYNTQNDPELDVTGGIRSDSLYIQLVNPLRLDVSWYIYQGNILLEKGYGKEFDLSYPGAFPDVTYYADIFYNMGDKEQVFRRTFVPRSDYLSVETDLPERAYPGQQIDVNIQVKDHAGKPVKEADLTAFAVNTLLNYDVPDLPYYGTPPRTREQRPAYSIHGKDCIFSMPLDYPFWNKTARLDEMPYYRFTYPGKSRFVYTVNTPDSTTQFAPFVMKDGEAVDIYVIEVNGRPVYFSWTEQPKGYSFLVSDTGKQQISLRLHDRVIILDSTQFEAGKKTIFSIDAEHYTQGAGVIKFPASDPYKPYSFTPTEISNFKNYISRIPVVQNNYVYLQQGETVYPVHHPCLSVYQPHVLAGPVPQGRTTYMDWITYRHEGGFSYQFEDNVVYKYPEMACCPGFLRFSSSNNFDCINDFYLSSKVMVELTEACELNKNNWRPGSIQIARQEMNLVLRLPEEKETPAVFNLLLRNKETQQILQPDKRTGETRYPEIPESIYDIILLYTNGNYLLAEGVPLKKHTYTEVNMRNLPVHEADSLSRKWLRLYPPSRDRKDNTFLYTEPVVKRTGENTVEGIVYDSLGESLAGVSVMLKGTATGTATDINGHFRIETDHLHRTLIFMYIGYKRKEVEVEPKTRLRVILEEERLAFEEVVVTGYGLSRRGALAGSVSADREAPSQAPPEQIEEAGVNNIETKEAEDRLYSELLQLNGLRTNYSDVGFWEPRLYTDEKGKASFSVTLPDNITRWDAVVYAMNRKLKTGTARQAIKSYKPLMVELKTPRFLVEGDSSSFAGTIRNYTHDKEISGIISFVSGQDTLLHKQIGFASSYQEYIPVTAGRTDSITATYLFTRDDGYNDGEKHSIPVEKQGTEIAEGTLRFLRNGDKQTVSADKGETVHISIAGKQADIYMDAVRYLTGYKYACNEQLASQLIGLLNDKLYRQYQNNAFKYDKNIREIIKRLTNNQNKDRLWSWFGQSGNTSYWMSAHILKALKMAKDAGYSVNLNIDRIEQDYMDTRSYRRRSLQDIGILHALSEWGTTQNYGAAADMFEEIIHQQEAHEDSVARANKTVRQKSYLKEKLLLWEIRQKQQYGYVSDSVSRYLHKDATGAVYCDDGIQRDWYAGHLATTLIAYRIIKEDSLLKKLKEPVQMYILGTWQEGWNTYLASSAVSVLLPDLLAESFGKDTPATVVLSGKERKEVTAFPFDTTLFAGESLNIEKINGMPLIYSAYRTVNVIEEHTGDAFEVSSVLSGGDTLTAGRPVSLTVEVKVKRKQAEHIMIEVPVPSGCSYASKPQSYYGGEVHREYFNEKAVLFCERLPEGTYTFTIPLLPRYSGTCLLNPAKVELMYFPVIHANNRLRKITINRRE